ANTLFKHPDHVKRCYALSGIYDMRDSMDGMYDDNFYFNNPVDYMANQNDPWYFHQYASCDIRLVTGCGPWENSGPSYRMSEILRNRGIGHHLDDWGPEGGHEWPYWHHQLWEHIGQHYYTLPCVIRDSSIMTMAKKVTGGCVCGPIRYQLLDKPMFVHCCHCDDCQRLTGSAFVLNAIIETQAIKLLRGK